MLVTVWDKRKIELAIMDQTFWNTRFAQNVSAYGYQPNLYFKQCLDAIKPGSILLPAEGEGRNAVYAASKGWIVDAFDFSSIARHKAMQLADNKGVIIDYSTLDITEFQAGKQYDVVGLIYVHLPAAIRTKFHQEVSQSLKPGGLMILEAFSKEQLQYESGGPKDINWLYDAPSLCNDFHLIHMLSCEQKEIIHEEGRFHRGRASVLQMMGQKI